MVHEGEVDAPVIKLEFSYANFFNLTNVGAMRIFSEYFSTALVAHFISSSSLLKIYCHSLWP